MIVSHGEQTCRRDAVRYGIHAEPLRDVRDCLDLLSWQVETNLVPLPDHCEHKSDPALVDAPNFVVS
jgi:hypothetical protein